MRSGSNSDATSSGQVRRSLRAHPELGLNRCSQVRGSNFQVRDKDVYKPLWLIKALPIIFTLVVIVFVS